MIVGFVQDNEARIALTLAGPDGRSCKIDAVVDTGFNSFLTLPSATIRSLGLSWRNTGRGALADGSEIRFEVYGCIVNWDGGEINITVDEAEATPLVGMRMLKGFELRVEVREGGKVGIMRLGK